MGGSRRNRAAEYKLTVDYLFRNLREWLYSIRGDGEDSQEGIEMWVKATGLVHDSLARLD